VQLRTDIYVRGEEGYNILCINNSISATNRQKEGEQVKLQLARLERGLGRIYAGKLCGMAYATLYVLESGKRTPGLEAALKISRALGLDPHDIDEFAPALKKAEALGLVIDLPETQVPEPLPLSKSHIAGMEAVRCRLRKEEEEEAGYAARGEVAQ